MQANGSPMATLCNAAWFLFLLLTLNSSTITPTSCELLCSSQTNKNTVLIFVTFFQLRNVLQLACYDSLRLFNLSTSQVYTANLLLPGTLQPVYHQLH